MKRLLLFILLPLVCYGAHKPKTLFHQQTAVETLRSDSLLSGIQDKIDSAFEEGMEHKEISELNRLGLALKKSYEQRALNLILYWRAYLQFYTAIYYLERADKTKSEIAINKGVSWMKHMKHKSSEDYALLALLQGFSIQFMGTMATIATSSSAEANIKRALAMDATNLRAYYVCANNDFYTPEVYGGGKVVEKYALKALSLPAQRFKNPYLPSWGKEESYEILIRFYVRKKKWVSAEKYYRKAIKAYPKSEFIKRAGSKIKSKVNEGTAF